MRAYIVVKGSHYALPISQHSAHAFHLVVMNLTINVNFSDMFGACWTSPELIGVAETRQPAKRLRFNEMGNVNTKRQEASNGLIWMG